jgi:hypothetical protein
MAWSSPLVAQVVLVVKVVETRRREMPSARYRE